MTSAPSFDSDLLRRYGIQGPRYTSYPPATQFQSVFTAADFTAHALMSGAAKAPRRLSLYMHVPYCFSPCFYCGCNRIITRDTAKGAVYVRRLKCEIEMAAKLFPNREVIQLHLGGGTPNFLSNADLSSLMEAASRIFRFSSAADRDFSIELDPRYVAPDAIANYAACGLNRASLGVQDFDESVQLAVNRLQSVKETMAAIEACRLHGFRSVNIDLIYGLPRQTLAGFARTLKTVIEARPDRLAVYGYAHMPSMFKAQRHINASALPHPELKLALLQLATEKLVAAGYRQIGMDHFALPNDELSIAQDNGSLHRNFMGYTTHAETDLVGLGVSAISHVGNSYSQNPRDLAAWETAIDQGRLPVWRGKTLDQDDCLRADVIQQWMCNGVVDIPVIERRHAIYFPHYFKKELDRLKVLEADGLVETHVDSIRATPRGRLLLRVVAMCFDRYLENPSIAAPLAVDTPRYSAAI